MKKEFIESDWRVKNVKFFMGHDGPKSSMTCSLYFQGKRVATVLDDSWGGGLQYEWTDPDLEKKLDEFAKQFSEEFYGKVLTYNSDMVVEELCNLFDVLKKCGKKTCFREKHFSADQHFPPLNEELMISGYLMKITGFNRKARKNSILIQKVSTGRVYVTTPSAVIQAYAIKKMKG